MRAVRISCRIENPLDRKKSARIANMRVESGSDFTWVPRKTLEKLGIDCEKSDVAFMRANGEEITRSTGFAIVRWYNTFTIDEVVFAEKGDLSLVGARALSGLNLYIDSYKSIGVGGPYPAPPLNPSLAATRALRRKSEFLVSEALTYSITTGALKIDGTVLDFGVPVAEAVRCGDRLIVRLELMGQRTPPQNVIALRRHGFVDWRIEPSPYDPAGVPYASIRIDESGKLIACDVKGGVYEVALNDGAVKLIDFAK